MVIPYTHNTPEEATETTEHSHTTLVRSVRSIGAGRPTSLPAHSAWPKPSSRRCMAGCGGHHNCATSHKPFVHMKMYNTLYLPRQTLRFHRFQADSRLPVPRHKLWLSSNTLAR
jgi:hypothetical protein